MLLNFHCFLLFFFFPSVYLYRVCSLSGFAYSSFFVWFCKLACYVFVSFVFFFFFVIVRVFVFFFVLSVIFFVFVEGFYFLPLSFSVSFFSSFFCVIFFPLFRFKREFSSLSFCAIFMFSLFFPSWPSLDHFHKSISDPGCNATCIVVILFHFYFLEVFP